MSALKCQNHLPGVKLPKPNWCMFELEHLQTGDFLPFLGVTWKQLLLPHTWTHVGGVGGALEQNRPQDT